MLTSSRLRIIVTGLIAQYPLGGVTWDYVQYVLGLVRLGRDVYCFEDTGQWPYRSSIITPGFAITSASKNSRLIVFEFTVTEIQHLQ